ncbi:Fumarate and nitrate reduction regulatory protein [Tepidimonas alkaliphilus]|uniref:Fumarate and nitrate reduction regulatory protein n=1 Tax=Tepidimonas alkaliphilus TaxID=2588942 RepID=A0A554W453_9BURK|nr:Crp/Fnr family transcriptional regulator [Tepidimonas alkaliphilus]TSE18354.1 Fumarate and nitrate reduction regulatory protein [Tepidimonas alkaliphilus]
MIPIKTESAWRGTADCKACGIRDMVLFADLNEQDFNLIHAPIDDLVYGVGQSLYAEAAPAHSVFTLRSGLIKLVRSTPDGRQRVLRVLRPGDVVGIEALAGPRYDSEAVALTEASVCRIPVDVIHRLAQHSPRLHMRLLQKWQAALREADDWLAALNFGTARQRVANFVLKMRHATDPQVVTLFSREDMGAMLDLKLETVSREVSALVKAGILEPLDRIGRLYRIADEAALQARITG